MKIRNLAIIATIVASFVFSMFAFQPTITEASCKLFPTTTPSPRKIRKMPRQAIEVENDETHRTRKPVTKKQPKKTTGFQELSGIGMEVTRRKNSKQVQTQYNPKELSVDKTAKRKSGKNEVSIETLKRNKRRYKK